jgi:hypothetical protein
MVVVPTEKWVVIWAMVQGRARGSDVRRVACAVSGSAWNTMV